MKKELKIALYCILGVILILVLCLMIWWRKHNAWEPDIAPSVEPWIVWQEISDDNIEEEVEQPSQHSEQDILNDLESLFRNDNGYEDVEWEFWFIGSDNE